jgi:hypothetical protein
MSPPLSRASSYQDARATSIACHQRTCALRAPTAFLVRIKTIRTKNAVMVKSNDGLALFLYKIADCVRIAFHPCAIDDPRGRLLVRATSQPCSDEARDSSRNA